MLQGAKCVAVKGLPGAKCPLCFCLCCSAGHTRPHRTTPDTECLDVTAMWAPVSWFPPLPTFPLCFLPSLYPLFSQPSSPTQLFFHASIFLLTHPVCPLKSSYPSTRSPNTEERERKLSCFPSLVSYLHLLYIIQLGLFLMKDHAHSISVHVSVFGSWHLHQGCAGLEVGDCHSHLPVL